MLLVQKGKDLNISVDSEVTRRLAEIQVQQKISDPDKFQAFIRDNTGMTYEDFKAQMKNQMLTQRVIGQEVDAQRHRAGSRDCRSTTTSIKRTSCARNRRCSSARS